MPAESPINAKRAAAVAGLSPQMLDYLEREGVFEREQVRTDAQAARRQRGIPRRYTFRDLVVLRAVSRLLSKGMSVRRIRQAIELFCRASRFECDRGQISFDAAAVQFFVTDGIDIFFHRDGAELVSILGNGQQTFLFVLDVCKLREEVIQLLPEGAKASRRA